MGFKETAASAISSLVITPPPSETIIVLQRFDLMSRLLRRAPYFTHSILWCRAYFGKPLIRPGVSSQWSPLQKKNHQTPQSFVVSGRLSKIDFY